MWIFCIGGHKAIQLWKLFGVGAATESRKLWQIYQSSQPQNLTMLYLALSNLLLLFWKCCTVAHISRRQTIHYPLATGVKNFKFWKIHVYVCTSKVPDSDFGKRQAQWQSMFSSSLISSRRHCLFSKSKFGFIESGPAPFEHKLSTYLIFGGGVKQDIGSRQSAARGQCSRFVPVHVQHAYVTLTNQVGKRYERIPW